jgi:hypothetical protein
MEPKRAMEVRQHLPKLPLCLARDATGLDHVDVLSEND